jgi:hypothetical protein
VPNLVWIGIIGLLLVIGVVVYLWRLPATVAGAYPDTEVDARRAETVRQRVGYWLAVLLLIIAAALHLWRLPTLSPGLSQDEITDIRVAETVRQRGDIQVFYRLDNQGREGLYHIALAAVTSLVGNGMLGYHMLSVWASLLMLAALYALVTRLYNPLAGVAAVGLLAVNLWFTVLGREVSREVLLPLLVTGVLLSLSRAFWTYQRTYPEVAPSQPFAALGILLGLGFYLHPAHFLVVLATMLFIAYMLLSRQPLGKRTLAYLGFSILVMMIIAMPYLISSIRLPGLAGANRLLGDYHFGERPIFQTITAGLNGFFFMGDSDPLHNVPGRPLIDLVSGLLLLVGLLMALRHWRQPRYALPLIMLICLLPVVLLSRGSPNFQAYSSVLPLVALYFGVGVNALYRGFSWPARRVAWAALAALLVFNLVWMSRDLFQTWPSLPEVQTAYNARLGEVAHHLDLTAEKIPSLICGPLDSSPELSGTDLVLLMMNRKDAPLRYADCGSGLVLMNGGDDQQVVLTGPLDGVHPYLRAWLEKGQFLDEPPDAVVRLNVSQELADTIGRFTTTAPAMLPPGAGGGLMPPPVRFGGNIAFLGYDRVGDEVYPPGGVVTSITYWRVDGPIPPDLRLFTHVLVDPTVIAAQNDTISVNLTQLDNRDIFVQITFVQLPPSIPEGTYDVSVGAYLDTSKQRMPVLGEDGSPRADRLFLGQITVKKSG